MSEVPDTQGARDHQTALRLMLEMTAAARDIERKRIQLNSLGFDVITKLMPGTCWLVMTFANKIEVETEA